MSTGRLIFWLQIMLMPGLPLQADTIAEQVFFNGAVYTMDTGHPWASAVAISEGRIVYVGDDSGVQAWVGPQTSVVNLAGRMMLPGFHDSHSHPMTAGTRFLRCQLKGLDWPGPVQQALAECAKNLRDGQWLRAVDLSAELFSRGLLHRETLDKLSPHHPVLVTDVSGYFGWASTRALEIAGIESLDDDDIRGLVFRDEDTGQLTGEVHGEAVGRLWAELPKYTRQELREALRRSSFMANGFGITSFNESRADASTLAAYFDADRAGELTVRVQASQAWDRNQPLAQINRMVAQRDRRTGRYFKADAIKLFLDGDFVFRSAGLLSPYAGTADDLGSTNYAPARLDEIVTVADAAGMQVHMHAVGSRAIHEALNAFEAAIAANGPGDRRHQIAHLRLIDPPDLPRFAELGVVANFQPLWFKLDEVQEFARDALGAERAERQMQIKRMFDSGARVVAGSDWISESMNPLVAIQIAVTRQPIDGSEPPFIPDERVSLARMLAAYTINGAWLARQDQLTGSIEVGKAADMIVLEKNLFDLPSTELHQVQVVMTLLDGRTVYRRSGSAE